MRYQQIIMKSNIDLFLEREIDRQQNSIDLIASENLPSKACRDMAGSLFMTKYSEGYPGKRYYAGCKHIDEMEEECKHLWQNVFDTNYAVNVQMPSGSQANHAAYLAVLNPGDKILAMDLSCGGHLSHSMSINLVSKLYEVHTYGLNKDTELLDYDEIRNIALKIKPKMIIAGASSYSKQILYSKFAEIADEIGAYFLADIAHPAGLIAKGLLQSPFGYADFVTSTTQKTLRGPRSALIFCKPEHERAMNRAAFPGLIGGCQQNMVAAKSVAASEIMTDEYYRYIRDVSYCSYYMAKTLKERGFRIVSGGTDNHLFVVDVADFGLSGKQVQDALESVGIYTNMNVIPYDTHKPSDPSGVRIGTPYIVSRGASLQLCIQIANSLAEIFNDLKRNEFEHKIVHHKEKVANYVERLNKIEV